MEVLRVIALVLMVALVIVLVIFDFMNKPKEEKVEVVVDSAKALIDWVKKYVIEAEIEYGPKVGSIKLAVVYNLAISAFPYIAEKYTLEEFDEKIIKPALEWMKEEAEKNPYIKKMLEF